MSVVDKKLRHSFFLPRFKCKSQDTTFCGSVGKEMRLVFSSEAEQRTEEPCGVVSLVG